MLLSIVSLFLAIAHIANGIYNTIEIVEDIEVGNICPSVMGN